MPGTYESIRAQGSFRPLSERRDRHPRRSPAMPTISATPSSSAAPYNWHWHKRPWTNLDIVVAENTGKVSFDLHLAADWENFELVKGGRKKDHCFICRWELFESQDDADHGTGHTNGHDWLCTECYTKFWQRPDFFSSSYSDIT